MNVRANLGLEGSSVAEAVRMHGAPSPHAAVAEGVALVKLHEKIRSLEPAVRPGSPPFHAAVFLLAALHVGQNTEKLAFYTRRPRPEVSRFARRLLDNGVWQAGGTYSLWRHPDRLDESFWLDAAVALGTLCRRIPEADVVEWAPAGYWTKWSHSDAEEMLIQPNLYIDRPLAGSSGDEPNSEVGTAGERVEVVKDREASADILRAQGAIRGGAPVQQAESDTPPAARGGDLFPGAAWLG